MKFYFMYNKDGIDELIVTECSNDFIYDFLKDKNIFINKMKCDVIDEIARVECIYDDYCKYGDNEMYKSKMIVNGIDRLSDDDLLDYGFYEKRQLIEPNVKFLYFSR